MFDHFKTISPITSNSANLSEAALKCYYYYYYYYYWWCCSMVVFSGLNKRLSWRRCGNAPEFEIETLYCSIKYSQAVGQLKIVFFECDPFARNRTTWCFQNFDSIHFQILVVGAVSFVRPLPSPFLTTNVCSWVHVDCMSPYRFSSSSRIYL